MSNWFGTKAGQGPKPQGQGKPPVRLPRAIKVLVIHGCVPAMWNARFCAVCGEPTIETD